MAFRRHDDELRESPTAPGFFTLVGEEDGAFAAVVKSMEDMKIAAAQSFGTACAPNPFHGVTVQQVTVIANSTVTIAPTSYQWQHMTVTL